MARHNLGTIIASETHIDCRGIFRVFPSFSELYRVIKKNIARLVPGLPLYALFVEE
jgi:hypothetical protein